jgi:hypothetical protein
MIQAKVIEDSMSPTGRRLTTLQLVYPRFIHAEFMTHRVFSRNASSSRAIPVSKMLAQVWNEPATPIHWGANQSGMQAERELTGLPRWIAQKVWKWSARVMCGFVWVGMKAGMHKQTANRLLEPWQNIHVVVSATEWNNFFDLRAHPDAQPEIHELALAIQGAMIRSMPVPRGTGDWHLPYVSQDERDGWSIDTLRKLSTARCARVSYLTHDGKKPDVEKDLMLYHRLVGSTPIHASPTEHQAMPISDVNDLRMTGNFYGWVQHRKLIEASFGSEN